MTELTSAHEVLCVIDNSLSIVFTHSAEEI